jgi:amphi-Trp domain-containing protein
MEIKKQPIKEKKTVQGHFSQEFYMSHQELAKFLRNLADQVEAGGDLNITTEEWILPFNPASHAKVDVDLEEDELEIEIEFKRSTGKLYAEPESETEKTGDDEHTSHQY